MSIPYKIIAIKNPNDPMSAPRYYPQLVTLGQTATLDTIAYEMEQNSSLSEGDIKSVLTNFVKAMRRALYNGHSVNIDGFGVFSLTSHSKGSDVKADCGIKNIVAVRINFRTSTKIRPNLVSKNQADVMTFIDVEKAIEEKKKEPADKE